MTAPEAFHQHLNGCADCKALPFRRLSDWLPALTRGCRTAAHTGAAGEGMSRAIEVSL